MKYYGIFLFFSISLLNSGCHAIDGDLRTAEDTVLNYCRSGVHDFESKFFSMEIKYEEPQPLGWKSCTIISTERTELVGQKIEGVIVSSEDMEVIQQVEFHEQGMQPRRFWYLLRNFDGEWKIIAYSILDEPELPD